MNARIMKYIGIAIMILAHPVGYYFWRSVLSGFLYGYSGFEWAHFAVLQGVGILEFFLVGVIVFIIGMLKDNHKNKN